MNNNSGNKLKANVNVRRGEVVDKCFYFTYQGVVSNLSRGGGLTFFLTRGAQQPLGAKNP